MNEMRQYDGELIYSDDEQAHYQFDTGAVIVFETADWPEQFPPGQELPENISILMEVRS